MWATSKVSKLNRDRDCGECNGVRTALKQPCHGAAAVARLSVEKEWNKGELTAEVWKPAGRVRGE